MASTQSGAAEEADADRWSGELAYGQRLVSDKGGLWRWDGFTVTAGAETAAAVRLAQGNRLAELRQMRTDLMPMLDRAEEGLTEARVALAQAGRNRAAAREAQEEAGLSLDPGSLMPYSHWTPPPIRLKRFLTWFFIAPAPEGPVRIDGGEIHDSAWMQPAEALRRRDAGEIELAPPTWVTLYELSSFANVGRALEHAKTRECEAFATRIGKVDGGVAALWHGDAGYATRDASLAGAIEGGLGAGSIPVPPGSNTEVVRNIAGRLDRNEYKRRQSPLVLRTSPKAFGSGRRLPIVQRYE